MNLESFESLWRQTLPIRNFARDEVDATRRRCADAEAAEAQTDLEEA
jgi:hypothetical protein